MSVTDSVSPAVARIPAERIVDLDVREDLRQGREPFARIMAAKDALPDGHVLRLRATFEPVPLYHVLGSQGFAHWTEQLAPDDWRVWFHRVGEDGSAPASADAPGEDVVVLDVRGLADPEPTLRTLEALAALPPGATLLQLNESVPHEFLPKLHELGFTHQVREQDERLVRVFIRRR